MDTLNRVKRAREMFTLGNLSELEQFRKTLRHEDPLALSIVDLSLAVLRDMPFDATKRGARLLPKVADKPELARYTFTQMGVAYRVMGELELSDNYFIKALDVSERTGDQTGITNARLHLTDNMLLRGEYEAVKAEIARLSKKLSSTLRLNFAYIMSQLAIFEGKPERCFGILDPILETMNRNDLWLGMLEVKADALRFIGKLNEASETIIEVTEGLSELGAAYSATPLAKAMNLAWFAGTEPPPRSLIRRCVSLAKKGSWAERAACRAIEAFLSGDETAIVESLFEAALDYERAYQHMEVFLSGLSAAYLAWRTENPLFFKIVKFLAPRAAMNPVFRQDPVLGEFMNRIEPLFREALGSSKDKGIRAYLIGDLRVSVNGNDINPIKWRSIKAAMLFIYLLLSPRHRIASDHLFYLLWPKKKYTGKNRQLLYQAVSFCRGILGASSLIAHRHDFYHIEGEVWTDLGEIEDLIRKADATPDPAEKEELLARARELAKGELLPEFPYDRYIDEYRQYYERLRKRLGLI